LKNKKTSIFFLSLFLFSSDLFSVIAITPEIKRAIVRAFENGTYCDIVISVYCVASNEYRDDKSPRKIVLGKAGFRFLRILDRHLQPEKVDLTSGLKIIPASCVGYYIKVFKPIMKYF
jgi:hypothetical protein